MCRVTSCCCCSSVETGTKVIAIVGIILGVIGLLGGGSGIILLIGSICLLIGVLKRKSVFVLIFLVLHGICIAVAFVALVVMALASAGVISAGFLDNDTSQLLIGETGLTEGNDLSAIGKDIDNVGSQDDAGATAAAIGVAIAAILVFVWNILAIYFWIVAYSFYRLVKEEGAQGEGYAMANQASKA